MAIELPNITHITLLLLLGAFSIELNAQYLPQTIQKIQIGALIYHNELNLEFSFESAIRQVNTELHAARLQLIPLIRRLSPTSDSEVLQNEACELIDNGVAAIFGPSSQAESDIVALICNSTGIPHILFDMWKGENIQERQNYQMTLNLYPYQLILSKAYADIIQSYGWRKFTIIYDEEDEGAPSRLQDLLQLRDLHNEVVRVRKYRRNDDYRILWKSIKGERRIVLDCDPDLLVELLNASIPFEMTGQFNHLFLTNLETQGADLEDLQDNVTFQVNMTAARLAFNELYFENGEWKIPHFNVTEADSMTLTKTLLPSLIADAVNLYAQTLLNITAVYRLPEPRVHCEFGLYGNAKTWAMGEYIHRVMKTINTLNNDNYRSGALQFDQSGQRVGFGIEIYEPLDNYGIATWDTKGQINPLHIQKAVTKKIIYRVATRIGEPYFMEDPEAASQNITGNGLYMGFAVDLIDALSKELGFEYIFVPVADGEYGKFNKDTKQWNGIIGELINNDAHMGICDLTITQARKTVVDFTVPFMQLGISILAYKEPHQPKNLFAFLEPFAVEVWVNVMISIFVISFAMMFVARISKNEWENPHPCNKDPELLENKWDMANTFWLTIASIMTAGCDILPRSSPMRAFNAMWWIFAIIIANSYMANLAAFLTNSQMVGTVTGIKDLAEQTKIKFGTIYGGSTYTFFSDSNETTYRLAFNIMNNDDPSAYTKGNNEGVERVLKNRGGYMFLMETTSLEYNLERNCELRMVGEKFGEKHYAIAVPFGAEYRSNLSVGILKLSERGQLFQMKTKWWKNSNESCYVEADPTATPDMTFEEVRGIFYTLAVGVFLAILLGIGEFLLHTHQVAVEEKLGFKQAFNKELKSVWTNKKLISGTPTASKSSSSEKTIKSYPKKDGRELQSIRSEKNEKCTDEIID